MTPVFWVTAGPRQRLIWVWRTLGRVEVTLLCHGFGFFSATVAAALKLTRGKTQRLRKCNRLITGSDKKIPLINEPGWIRFLSSSEKVTTKRLDGQKLLDPSNYPPILFYYGKLLFKNVSHLFLDISFKCKSGKTYWQWQKWLLLKGYATQHSSKGLPAWGGGGGCRQWWLSPHDKLANWQVHLLPWQHNTKQQESEVTK